MKRTWIKIKRGILEPKHIQKLGGAWYLYFYILDQTEWESGTLRGWKDKYAAADFGLTVLQIRDHRQRLVREGYIACEQEQHSLKIIVSNWTDPRRYDGLVINEKPQGTEISLPKDDVKTAENAQGKAQGTGQGVKSYAVNPHISYSHTSHINTLTIKDVNSKARNVPAHIFTTNTIDRLFAYGVAKSVIREVNASPQGWTDASVNRCIDDFRARKGDDIGGLLTVTLRQPVMRKYLAVKAVENTAKYLTGEYAGIINH